MSQAQRYHSQSTSIGLLANVADHQERQYRRHIERNEEMATGLAMRLARNDQLEQFCGSDFTEECREKLKALASDNVSKERRLRAYASAIGVVIEKACNNETNDGQENDDPNNNNNNNNTHEFKKQMKTEYARALESIEKDSLKITQEPSYLKLCKQLGEDQNEDEDDELAVVSNGHDSGTNKLKCPLTMRLMEEPVRSRVCGHSFSKHAIVAHLRISRECPVPGCVNRQMRVAELEDDMETTMRIRRHKKRESATKKATRGLLDDEEEEEEFQ